jgi:taurine dioxygenase
MVAFEVHEIAPTLGAQITGFDPSAELDGETCRVLRQTLDDRGVLLFRDLDVDLEQQTRLCRMLIGEPYWEPPAPSGREGAYYVSNKEPDSGAPFGRLAFHVDLMWSPAVFQVLSLYGTEVEEPAATTVFTNSAEAWRSLPDDLRARVDGLRAVHGDGSDYTRRLDGGKEALVVAFETADTVTLPIAYPHPRTGQTLLYVSEFNTQRIEGLDPAESAALLGELYEHLYDPSRCVEHNWRNRDLVIFDNIGMQHARGNVELDGPTRTLRKVFAPAPRPGVSVKPTYATLG